jgi:hypothetical protein
MDELTARVLKLFIEMGRNSLDLHTLFEAGGNDPSTRERVLDVITRLVDSGQFATVVICEDSLPDGSWQDVLRTMQALGRSPALIVTSRPITGSGRRC